MSEKQEVYIPIAMPKPGVVMTCRRANLVVRDTDGTEIVGTEVVVEHQMNAPESMKVIMSLEQGIQMIGMLITQSGLTTKDVMSMVEEAHEKVYSESFLTLEAMRAKGEKFLTDAGVCVVENVNQADNDGNYTDPGKQTGSLYE